jgi:hypothetical protein
VKDSTGGATVIAPAGAGFEMAEERLEAGNTASRRFVQRAVDGWPVPGYLLNFLRGRSGEFDLLVQPIEGAEKAGAAS